MPPELYFREATAADRSRLISLVNAAYSIETFLEGTRTDDERITAMMEKGTILIAEEACKDGRPEVVGCVYIEFRGNRGYLGQLAVDPAHQGRGLARVLVNAAEERFRRAGCEAVDITVLNLRPELPPIYRRFGYIESGVVEEFRPTRKLAPGVEIHGIRMSKRLSPEPAR